MDEELRHWYVACVTCSKRCIAFFLLHQCAPLLIIGHSLVSTYCRRMRQQQLENERGALEQEESMERAAIR